MSKTMRDAFWDEIYELAKSDKDIVIVTADLGAPALDKFRKDFPRQYINTGISEQNAILIAAGLAMIGKKPIAYAISQFITLRCFEQIRVYPCGMNLPVTILGVGAGACYWESGPTHCCMEQLSVMRTLPNIRLINVSDADMAQKAAVYAVKSNHPKYIQLDREIIAAAGNEPPDFDKGFRVVKKGGDIAVIATGIMVKECAQILNETEKFERYEIELIDLFSMTPNKDTLLSYLKTKKRLITVEENTLAGGMGSMIIEMFNDEELLIPIKRIGMHADNGYEPSYRYGNRETVREGYRMGRQIIYDVIDKCID